VREIAPLDLTARPTETGWEAASETAEGWAKKFQALKDGISFWKLASSHATDAWHGPPPRPNPCYGVPLTCIQRQQVRVWLGGKEEAIICGLFWLMQPRLRAFSSLAAHRYMKQSSSRSHSDKQEGCDRRTTELFFSGLKQKRFGSASTRSILISPSGNPPPRV
jgi:hypothetical protein